MERKAEDIRFDALRNAIYHSSRRQFLDLQNRLLTLVVIAAGTAAVGDLGARFCVDEKVLAAIAALAGTLQLVFDLGSKARTHEFLQRRYYEIIANIVETSAPSESHLARWEAELNRLYAEEPPPMRALDAVAYNAACDSLGYAAGKRVEISLWQSLWRQWWPFHGATFDWKEEKERK